MADNVIAFPTKGRTARAIVIRPDGDGCRALLAGAPLHDGGQFDITGPLWRVQMVVHDNRHGLPIMVDPACHRRAGQ